MDNIDLIRKIAWSFHYTTGLDWDDLFQEAALACYEAMDSYDPNRGKLSTHLWHRMTRRLQTYLQKQDHYRIHKDWRSNTAGICHLEDIKIDKAAEETELWWEGLSNEAFEIAKMILASPKPYLKRNKLKAVRRIKHVMKNNGWDWRKTRQGLEDLGMAYS